MLLPHSAQRARGAAGAVSNKRLVAGVIAVALAGLAFWWWQPAEPEQHDALSVPAGYKLSVYAEGFSKPRFMALSPNGDVFLSDMSAGTVLVLRDADKDGRAEQTLTFASGLQDPHGLAFHGRYLYVAAGNAVLRYAYRAGDAIAQNPAEVLLKLPVGGHGTRTIVFGPDNRMYVSVGSTGNANEESDPRRAAVWVHDEHGQNGRLFASGLRNAVGLAFIGNDLYATNNGQDHLGDELPREAIFKLADGGFYGWPYCYVTGTGEPQAWDKSLGKKSPEVCATAGRTVATVTAHSAPLGLAHLDGKFLVALHGSWARSQKTGYKVVSVDPVTGTVDDFLAGFLQGESVSGRPVDVLVTQDGAILVSDDGAGKVWRVSKGS